MSLFELGAVLMTSEVARMVEEDGAIGTVLDCLQRHASGDWGDLCEDDKAMNDESLEAEKNGDWADSLYSSYETDVGKIYVITECDRSATTILLPEEY